MQDCYICKKHRGDFDSAVLKIYEEELLAAYHLDPKDEKVYLGYIIIELKRHIKGLADMNDAEACALGRTLQKISSAYMKYFPVEHVYSHVMGDSIPHLHVHIIPRYKGAPREYWGLKTDEWPEAPRGDRQKVSEFCLELAKHLI
jgi:diadenosine tetraphosphate (Ap4A) HIT family hydrolase